LGVFRDPHQLDSPLRRRPSDSCSASGNGASCRLAPISQRKRLHRALALQPTPPAELEPGSVAATSSVYTGSERQRPAHAPGVSSGGQQSLHCAPAVPTAAPAIVAAAPPAAPAAYPGSVRQSLHCTPAVPAAATPAAAAAAPLAPQRRLSSPVSAVPALQPSGASCCSGSRMRGAAPAPAAPVRNRTRSISSQWRPLPRQCQRGAPVAEARGLHRPPVAAPVAASGSCAFISLAGSAPRHRTPSPQHSAAPARRSVLSSCGQRRRLRRQGPPVAVSALAAPASAHTCASGTVQCLRSSYQRHLHQ